MQKKSQDDYYLTLKDIFTHDFGQFKMILDSKDPDVSRQIRERGWYVEEQFDTDIFRRHLKPGMKVADLGANVGFYTFLARSIVGSKGRIFTFEPFPRNADLLRETVRINSFQNVIVVQAAVSDRNRKSSLYLSPDASSEHSLLNLDFNYNQNNNAKVKKKSPITVDVIRLDDYFINNVGSTKIDIIKMDIEGSEFRAFNGMKRIIQDNKSLTLMIEFWPNGFRKQRKDPYEFLKMVEESGFSIQFIDNLKRKLARVSVQDLREIEEARIHDASVQNSVMKVWGWYTNLLCLRK